jgi:hypothetical protein
MVRRRDRVFSIYYTGHRRVRKPKPEGHRFVRDADDLAPMRMGGKTSERENPWISNGAATSADRFPKQNIESEETFAGCANGEH